MYFNTVKGGGGTNFPFVQEAQGQGAVSQNPEGVRRLLAYNTPRPPPRVLFTSTHIRRDRCSEHLIQLLCAVP